jgi:hypothetical protein
MNQHMVEMEQEAGIGSRSLLSGTSAKHFRILRSRGRVDGAMAVEVLSGHAAAYHAAEAIPEELCAALAERFLERAGKTNRGDDVPGFSIGAYHYGKTLTRYFEQAESAREDLMSFYDGLRDPTDLVREALTGALQPQGMRLRAAAFEGSEAAASRVTSWKGAGEYLLLPHDDAGQLYDARQSEFEIQKARRGAIAAANCYPSVGPYGSKLRMWNLRPDTETRRRLGIEESGYFYPPELLEGYEQVTLPIGPGDVVILDGSYIHAVPACAGDARRITINCFFAAVSKQECVWWT